MKQGRKGKNTRKEKERRKEKEKGDEKKNPRVYNNKKAPEEWDANLALVLMESNDITFAPI